MKLNKHQKEVVAKILNNEVYDILSYLKCFGKCHIAKYDIEELEKKFYESEKGKKYKVFKEGHIPWVVENQTIKFGLVPATLPNFKIRTDIEDDDWEYKEAIFDANINPTKYEFNEQKFEFDFVNGGTLIVNNFSELVDFLTLWNYFKQEGLVFEVDKPISSEEIGIFFEPVQISKKEERKVSYKSTSKKDIVGEYLKAFETKNKNQNENEKDNKIKNEVDDIDIVPPIRNAGEFIEKTWEINETNITMCKEFIGKKLIPTSSLFTYSKHKFKTREEISQKKNLFVAWLAVLISVVSVVIGNIIPLTQPQPVDYYPTIEERLEEIKEEIIELKEKNSAKDDNEGH